MIQTKQAYKQQGNVGLLDSDETMEKLNNRFCAERGLQHPDKPGLQPVPVRASDASWNELGNRVQIRYLYI